MAPVAIVRPPFEMMREQSRIFGGHKVSNGIFNKALLSVGELSHAFNKFISISHLPRQTLDLLSQLPKKLDRILTAGNSPVVALPHVFHTSLDALLEFSVEHQEDIGQDLLFRLSFD